MKNNYLALFLFIFLCSYNPKIIAQTQALVIKSIYTSGAKLVATDNLGNMYVSGYFNGELMVGKERFFERNGKYFLLKYNAQNQVIWGIQLAYPIKDIVLTDNALYALGQFQKETQIQEQSLTAKGNYETYLIKLNFAGEIVWYRQISSNQDALAGGLGLDAQKNVFVVGSFVGDVHLGDTTLLAIQQKNVYLAKYNDTGKLLWVRQATGGVDIVTGIYAWGITTDPQGNIYLSGSVTGIGWFGREKVISSYEVFKGEGWTYNSDIFLAKYSAEGALTWVKTIAQNAEIHDIVADSQGCVYVGGHFRGSANLSKGLGEAQFDDTRLKTNINENKQPIERMYLAKYSPLGNLIWIKNPESNGNTRALNLAFSPFKNRIFVSGYFNETIHFGKTSLQNINQSNPSKSDIFLAAYLPSGALDWAKSAGGEDSEEVADCGVDTQGNIYLVGRFRQKAHFGEFILESEGNGSNAFVVKY